MESRQNYFDERGGSSPYRIHREFAEKRKAKMADAREFCEATGCHDLNAWKHRILQSTLFGSTQWPIDCT